MAFGDDAALRIPDFPGFSAGVAHEVPGPGALSSVSSASIVPQTGGRAGGRFERKLGWARCVRLPALGSPPGGIQPGSRAFRRPGGPGRKCKARRQSARRARGAFRRRAGFSSFLRVSPQVGYGFHGPEPAPPSPLRKAGPRPPACLLSVSSGLEHQGAGPESQRIRLARFGSQVPRVLLPVRVSWTFYQSVYPMVTGSQGSLSSAEPYRLSPSVSFLHPWRLYTR